VDPAVLETYAGVYGVQRDTPPTRVKFEESRLWILSMDGERWDPLCAETEARFYLQGQDIFCFEFIRDESGGVTALRVELLGFPLPAAPKVESSALG
jgi:hypothetical protein